MFQQLGNLIGSTPAVGTNQPAGGLASLLSSGLKCSQNEGRLMAEKSQRNLLRKYLTQATGDPIQSALISNTIPGKGYGDTLDVGLGTFRPVKEEDIKDHKMHVETYEITKDSADKINKAVDEGRRVICVGTTSVRVLESVADETGHVKPFKGATNIFIFPGYTFKVVKGLITNFHLPESTLIMLVSAFLGREETLNMYKVAVEEKYRFFSFGDATMLI